MTWITKMVWSHLEPDILECKVKRGLGSITTNKASGGNGIPAELLQILNDDVVKVSHVLHMLANLENSAVATGLEKVSFHSNPKERQCQRMFKLPSCSYFTCYQGYAQILQARLQQSVNRELPGVQAEFKKGRGTRDQIANIHWIIEKARELKKKSTYTSLTTLKPLTVWITTNWNSSSDRNTRPPYLSPEKPVCSPRGNS